MWLCDHESKGLVFDYYLRILVLAKIEHCLIKFNTLKKDFFVGPFVTKDWFLNIF